jgi:hypothetical protein
MWRQPPSAVRDGCPPLISIFLEGRVGILTLLLSDPSTHSKKSLQPSHPDLPLKGMLDRTQTSPSGLLSWFQKRDTLIPYHLYV